MRLRLIRNTNLEAAKVKPTHAPIVRGAAIEIEISDETLTRQLLARNHGPSCAAFIAFKFRTALHRRGFFVLRLEPEQEMPMWFALAVRCFQDREGWSLVEHTNRGARFFTIRWLKWASLVHERNTTHLHIVR